MATTTRSPVPVAASLREALDWCEGARFQGARLSDLLEHQVAFDHANAMAAEWRALKAANVLPGGARVEALESYFLLEALRHLLLSRAPLPRRGSGLPKEVAAAVKAFKAAVPALPVVRAALGNDHSIRGAELPNLDMKTPDAGFVLKAAKGRDYLLAGGVNFPRTMAALEPLRAALAAALTAGSPAAP